MKNFWSTECFQEILRGDFLQNRVLGAQNYEISAQNQSDARMRN